MRLGLILSLATIAAVCVPFVHCVYHVVQRTNLYFDLVEEGHVSK